MPADFEIWQLIATCAFGVGPVGVTIFLWRQDHKALQRRLQEEKRVAAGRSMANATMALGPELEHSDFRGSLFKSRMTMPEHDIQSAYGIAAWPLSSAVEKWISETAHTLDNDASLPEAPQPAVPLALSSAVYELTRLLQLWESDSEFRVQLFRSYLFMALYSEYGGSEKLPPSEFERLLRDQILLNKSWHPWLLKSRLSPGRIRWERFVANLRHLLPSARQISAN